MIEIYELEEWYTAFGCSSLVITDDGLIYSKKEYDKYSGKPIGKVDFEKGFIYGRDYHNYIKRPVGAIKKKGDLTVIYGPDYDTFNPRILYSINNNKVYSGNLYDDILPSEVGVIKGGLPDVPDEEIIDDRGGGTGGSTGGGFDSTGGGFDSTGGGSAATGGKESGLGRLIKWTLIIIALVALCIFMAKEMFITNINTEEGLMAWVSIGLGAVVALLTAKDAEQSIVRTGVTASLFTWVTNLLYTKFYQGGFDGGDILVEIILAPFLLALVYAIPSVIVGLLISLIKGHFKKKEKKNKA